MKAAFIKRYNKVKIVDIPVPKPEGKDVLIRIDACGVCGSDFIEAKVWAREWKRFGHEIAATVVEIGEDVSELSVGDQVVVALSVPCGNCTPCIEGNPRKCNRMIVAEQGGFAEYLLVKDYRLLYKVEPVLPAELACLAEPLTVILDAFHLADLRKRNHLLVVGGGNIGILALLTAKTLGVNVLGVLGRKMNSGITTCLNETGGDFFPWRTLAGLTVAAPHDLKKRLPGISERIVVLHTAPPCYVPKYLDALPFDSTVVNIGLSALRRENKVKLDASTMIFKRIQFMSAFPVPCMFLSQAVSLLQEHSALFSSLPTEQLLLERLPRVFTNPKWPKNKILIRPNKSME